MADSPSSAAALPFQYPSVDYFSFVTTSSVTASPAVVVTIRRLERIFPLSHLPVNESVNPMSFMEAHSFKFEHPSCLTSPVVWHQAVASMLSRFNFGPEAGYRVSDKLHSFRRTALEEPQEVFLEVEIDVGETVVAEALPTPTRNSFAAVGDFVGRLKRKREEEMGEGGDKCCVICMEEYLWKDGMVVVVEMPCLHVFHGDCIASWLCWRSVCPLCNSTVQIHT